MIDGLVQETALVVHIFQIFLKNEQALSTFVHCEMEELYK